MPDKPKPGSYIDTQGMSGPTDPRAKSSGKQEYKPAIITPRRLFTPTYAKEMKILINEVLDEREGRMNYTSYFETTEYKHPVTEEEPAYTGRSPSFKEVILEALREWVKETEYLTQPTDPEGRYYCSKSDCEGVRFNE